MLEQIAPYFGYLATVLLAIGLLVNNDLKFRWLNTGGSIAFIIYGIILGALPIILTNSLLVAINLFYLYKIYTRKEHFELLEFNNGDIMMDRFLSFYQADIALHFPDFRREQTEGNLNFIVLRDLVIANIFSAKLAGDGTAAVVINYTLAKYRDYKVGRFIFEKEKEYLLRKGVRTIYYTTVASKRHKKFLQVMGFTLQELNGIQYLAKKI